MILMITLLLTCFSEFSLNNYSILKRMENPGKNEILLHIVGDPLHQVFEENSFSGPV